MSERDAWDAGYRAGREDALWSLGAGAPISRDNPYWLKCESCGCDLRYPTAIHVVDCKQAKEGKHD